MVLIARASPAHAGGVLTTAPVLDIVRKDCETIHIAWRRDLSSQQNSTPTAPQTSPAPTDRLRGQRAPTPSPSPS
jgi:hypothetical protein